MDLCRSNVQVVDRYFVSLGRTGYALAYVCKQYTLYADTVGLVRIRLLYTCRAGRTGQAVQ